jgi:hypothetical protein
MADEGEDHLGMTDEQWAQFQEYTHGYGDQDENGIDLSLLRENLKLSPTERIEKHDRSLAVVMELTRAAKAAGIWHDLAGARRA